MSTKPRTAPAKKMLILVEYAQGREDQAKEKAAEVERKTGHAVVTLPMGEINLRIGWPQ